MDKLQDKVKLPKEVAVAVEKVWDAVKDDICIKHMRLINWNFLLEEVHQVLDCDVRTLIGYAEKFPFEYMQALVNGYEVEQTPEDKCRDLYKNPNIHELNPNSYRMGIMDTLNALGKIIEGVND